MKTLSFMERVFFSNLYELLSVKFKLFFLLFFYLILANVPLNALIRLPKLISDGMVLQRDTHVKIWGWATPSEHVSIAIDKHTYTTIADANGNWSVSLDPCKAGGPYSMSVKGENSITIKNIMFGEVWVCSGQSNMELPIRRVSPIYQSEIESSTNNNIRCFTVPQKYNFKQELTDFEDESWQTANPKSIQNFSAVAYFFARELNQKYHVPVGIIVAALGGSPIEAWVSESTLKKYPHYYQEMQRWKDDNLINTTESSEQTKIKAWYDQLRNKDEGFKNPQQSWLDPSCNATNWSTMKVPGYWQKTALEAISGVVWFRKEISLPTQMAGKAAKLLVGRIVDADSVFVNGQFVGTTSYQYPPRRYEVPAGILKAGKNTIIVRVISNTGQGGFVPDKQYTLSDGTTTIDLKGEWQYKIGAVMDTPTPAQTFVRWKPGGLYNAMLAPLFHYAIKGALWYQGESNTDRATEYKSMLPDLIADWRSRWNEGNFPFIIAQLPNFMEAKSEPTESDWAQLRNAQLKALSVLSTALAVNIDLGEWNDIHPLNKKDVSHRLFLGAEKVAYKERIVSCGPLYQSMKITGNKALLKFSNCGSGLIIKKGTKLQEFTIAGIDGKYVRANAKIENGKVVVWNDAIQKPVSVRYAWADNPANANLYNKEGLPATPFSTEK
jgi:sialate O-acetylesterase